MTDLTHFFPVFDYVRNHPGCTFAEAIVHGYISSWYGVNRTGSCFASVAKIASETGYSRRTVQKAISALVKRGHLFRETRWRGPSEMDSNRLLPRHAAHNNPITIKFKPGPPKGSPGDVLFTSDRLGGMVPHTDEFYDPQDNLKPRPRRN